MREEKIEAATAEPKSAPSMIASATAVAIASWPTNELISSAVAVELCSAAPAATPDASALRRFPDQRAISF